MSNPKGMKTPIFQEIQAKEGVKLEELMDIIRYSSIIWGLPCLATKSKLDLCVTAIMRAVYVEKQCHEHFVSVKRALLYLKETGVWKINLSPGPGNQFRAYPKASCTGGHEAKRRIKTILLLKYGEAVIFTTSQRHKLSHSVLQNRNTLLCQRLVQSFIGLINCSKNMVNHKMKRLSFRITLLPLNGQIEEQLNTSRRRSISMYAMGTSRTWSNKRKSTFERCLQMTCSAIS